VCAVSLRRRWETRRVSETEKRPLLVLWDIDHTLIETRGFGRELYRRAFEEVTGRRMERPAEVTGRTELAIFAETLKLHDIEPSAELEQHYVDALARQYRDNIDELRKQGRALSGARTTLALLAEEPNIFQSVLTGNLRRVAASKLAAFGLDPYLDFEIGAYGDDHMERPQLVSLAQHRAQKKSHDVFDASNTVLVGDSLQDVSAGRIGGATVVGIASGTESSDSLARAGAVATFRGLEDAAATAPTDTSQRTHQR